MIAEQQSTRVRIILLARILLRLFQNAGACSTAKIFVNVRYAELPALKFFALTMSKYNFGKRLRCWTCKANGDDRFFDGRAKLQLHERTMHAERQQKDNRKRTSSLYCSYGSRISAPEYSSTIGSKLLENGE